MSRSALGFTSYVVATAAVTTAAVYHAFATRKEFYPASIYLTTSKVNLLVWSGGGGLCCAAADLWVVVVVVM